MALGRLHLYIRAQYHGRTVQELALPAGVALEVGHRGPLDIPIHKDLPFLFRVEWRAGGVDVADGTGAAHRLDGSQEMELSLGEITVSMALMRRARLRRLGSFGWRGSLAWFVVVMGTTLLPSQAHTLWEMRCKTAPVFIAWEVPPPRWMGACFAHEEESTYNDRFTAEYLDRLLRQDYEGADEGLLTDRWQREEQARKRDEMFIPAGSDGIKKDMGGGEQVGPDPERTPPVDEVVPEVQAKKEEITPIIVDGTEGSAPVPAVEASSDAPEEAAQEAVEEKEGWGIPDWYDTQDQAVDDAEVRKMIAVAKEVIRIDPEDAYALSLLAYYQYLAMDFDETLKTYDRYIALNPLDPGGYNNKSLVYKRLGNYAEEERLLKMALFLSPDDSTALNNLAINLAHRGQYDEALRVMKKLETLLPNDPYADLHRAKIYAAKGDEANAYLHLERALAGMKAMDTLHEIEFTQDIRVDPVFKNMRGQKQFRELMWYYYGDAKEKP